MKNLKTFIAILAISLSTIFSTTASEKEPSKITKKLRTEIVSMLDLKIKMEINKSSKVDLSFMINNKNEIVIVNIDSNVDEFKFYLKSKLNYKKIKLKGVKKGEIFKMPIKLNKK